MTLFALFMGIFIHFQTLLHSCYVSAAKHRPHFSEFLALRSLTWKLVTGGNLCAIWKGSAAAAMLRLLSRSVQGTSWTPASSDSHLAARQALCTLDPHVQLLLQASQPLHEMWRQQETHIGACSAFQVPAHPCSSPLHVHLSFQMPALQTSGSAPDITATDLETV